MVGSLVDTYCIRDSPGFVQVLRGRTNLDFAFSFMPGSPTIETINEVL